jgi:hypothetical protein
VINVLKINKIHSCFHSWRVANVRVVGENSNNGRNKGIKIKSEMEEIKNQIIKSELDSNIKNGSVKILAYPYVNKGLEILFNFYDIQNNLIYHFPEINIDLLYEYFLENSPIKKTNYIEIIIQDGKIKEMIEKWDEQIVINFKNKLPKSKRGKIKPWYEN